MIWDLQSGKSGLVVFQTTAFSPTVPQAKDDGLRETKTVMEGQGTTCVGEWMGNLAF
jgi:hypothetical protein